MPIFWKPPVSGMKAYPMAWSVSVGTGVWPDELEFSISFPGRAEPLKFYWTPRIPGKTANLWISINSKDYEFLTGKPSVSRWTLSHGKFTSQKAVKEAIAEYIGESPRAKGAL